MKRSQSIPLQQLILAGIHNPEGLIRLAKFLELDHLIEGKSIQEIIKIVDQFLRFQKEIQTAHGK